MNNTNLIRYLTSKNYAGLAFEVKDSLFFRVMEIILIICTFTFTIGSMFFFFSNPGTMLFLNIILGLFVGPVALHFMCRFSKKQKSHLKAMRSIVDDLFNDEEKLKGFIKECVLMARNNAINENFAKAELYTQIIDCQKKGNRSEFQYHLELFLYKYMAAVGPVQKKEDAQNNFYKYINLPMEQDNDKDILGMDGGERHVDNKDEDKKSITRSEEERAGLNSLALSVKNYLYHK